MGTGGRALHLWPPLHSCPALRVLGTALPTTHCQAPRVLHPGKTLSSELWLLTRIPDKSAFWSLTFPICNMGMILALLDRHEDKTVWLLPGGLRTVLPHIRGGSPSPGPLPGSGHRPGGDSHSRQHYSTVTGAERASKREPWPRTPALGRAALQQALKHR